MKKIISTVIVLIITLFTLVGCDLNDYEYIPPTSPIAKTYGKVIYKDNTIMGTTKIEPIVNGGYQIYNIGTGSVVGFIQADAVVNNIGGKDLGICEGATVTVQGLSGDCILPIINPIQIFKPVVDNGTCSDTRNGDFNPSYNTSVCNANGYFWCSLAHQCLNKPVNVPTCGEIGSEQRRILNEET